MRTARPCRRKLRGILPAPFESRGEIIFVFHENWRDRSVRKSRGDRALARRKKEKIYIAHIAGSFTRNLGVSLETILSSRWKRHDPSGLDWANERANERSLIPDEDGTIDGAEARERDGECPKLRWCQWTRPCEELAGGLLHGYTHYIGVLSFPWDRD